MYDWAFHALGSFESSLRFEPRGPIGIALGYQHLGELREARTDGDWWARWEQDGARFTLRVKAAPGTVIFAGVGPGKDPATRVAMVIVRRRAAQTVFEARHEFSAG